MRTLSLRELNRTTLLRQMLLARRRVGVVRAIERLAALQAQSMPSPYVALWSRVEGFRPRSLVHALEREQVLKAWLMRTTLHLVSARDYPLYATALRTGRPGNSRATVARPAERLVERVAAFVGEHPRTRRELFAHLEELRGPADEITSIRELAWFTFLIPLEHSFETALWGYNGRGVTLRALSFERPRLDEALVHLVRRYLAAFGPASRADLSQWSGETIRVLSPALDRMQLRRFVTESGRELLDLPHAPVASVDTPAPVRFLPMWDELLLAHDDRTRVLPEEYRKAVIARNGDVAQTFLVDGFVAGTWRFKDGRVAIEPFTPLRRTTRRELEDEAGRLTELLR